MQKSEKSSDPNREYLFLGETPLWKWLVKAMLGEKRPSQPTRIACLVQWGISIFLIAWHGLRFFALSNRALIEEKKGIRVELLIHLKAFILGFEPDAFLERLEWLHVLGVVSWGIVLFGVVFMYRQSKAYLWVACTGLFIYFLSHVVFFSWSYFFKEVGLGEQLLVLISFLLFLLHYLFFNGKEVGTTTA
jgi:hypothetical protein